MCESMDFSDDRNLMAAVAEKSKGKRYSGIDALLPHTSVNEQNAKGITNFLCSLIQRNMKVL